MLLILLLLASGGAPDGDPADDPAPEPEVPQNNPERPLGPDELRLWPRDCHFMMADMNCENIAWVNRETLVLYYVYTEFCDDGEHACNAIGPIYQWTFCMARTVPADEPPATNCTGSCQFRPVLGEDEELYMKCDREQVEDLYEDACVRRLQRFQQVPCLLADCSSMPCPIEVAAIEGDYETIDSWEIRTEAQLLATLIAAGVDPESLGF